MEFRLFGEVQLRAGGKLADVGTPRQQAVLAALLVDAGKPVPIETLIDRVWNETPPAEVRNVLYSHLSRIRRLLKDTARLERRPAGYVLDVPPGSVDMHRFWQLVEQSKDLSDTDKAATLAEALALWRGPPLAGVQGEWVDQVRDRWSRRRLDAIVQWGDVELRLGRPAQVIDVFRDLAAEYPLAEQFEHVLMRALHAAGRDAEALDRYTVIRQRLADELGTGPGPELQALHSSLLRGELPKPRRANSAAPAQLPPDVYGFAGREEQLGQLGKLERARIVVVSGTAGVGKTSLVVHWAHQVRADFPDGQLYLNLRGFDPTGTPVAPAEAVRGFLDAFYVPRERVPAGFEAQVGLYRSLLADRRVLIVLDNARDAEQVRPLLPGSSQCLVLVTSRDQLAGLVAEGAHPLMLDLLDVAEARTLLVRRIGAERVAAESEAVDEIIRLCARLPLALAVVAARAATHPKFSLAALADELREGLDELSGADPATDPRAVFSWSYLQLNETSARLFRLLGLHPGPDFGIRAAASMAGLPVAQVRPPLAELAGAHLVAEESPGRYEFHDLLRAYAAELAQGDSDRHAARRRMLGYYVHNGNRADRLLDPFRENPPGFPELPGHVVVESISDKARALAWFNAEYRVMLAVINQTHGFDEEVWSLAWTLRRYFTRRGLRHEQLSALLPALEAARRMGDPAKEAYAQCFIGSSHVLFGRVDEGAELLGVALGLYRKAGDRLGEGLVLQCFCWMLERENRHAEALKYAQHCLDVFRAAGHKPGEGRALNAVGFLHALLGAHVDALNYCQKAIDLQLKLGDSVGAAQTWDSLGLAYSRLGDHERAIVCHQSSVDVNRELGNRHSEAIALTSLGDAYKNAGDIESAHIAWQRAVEKFEQIGIPEADEVRAKLG
ncbi:AfsR/SARP family transcriptional regulator [Kibdelosporangium aridum]|uniref:DNA-binding transcriptional activator of the SARP family n=1 Tax=Kibdelosporangium aridum TaxID=2030 RepID=A0A1Y5XRL6_KIBAR|nr:BTAD domain-containing putative transcriptional regulator [Kibdelosporangium aridum]SMD07968.1 DNA-binding transcriptional activator of the SARP family [Kibdelosporangium aridum]